MLLGHVPAAVATAGACLYLHGGDDLLVVAKHQDVDVRESRRGERSEQALSVELEEHIVLASRPHEAAFDRVTIDRHLSLIGVSRLDP